MQHDNVLRQPLRYCLALWHQEIAATILYGDQGIVPRIKRHIELLGVFQVHVMVRLHAVPGHCLSGLGGRFSPSFPHFPAGGEEQQKKHKNDG